MCVQIIIAKTLYNLVQIISKRLIYKIYTFFSFLQRLPVRDICSALTENHIYHYPNGQYNWNFLISSQYIDGLNETMISSYIRTSPLIHDEDIEVIFVPLPRMNITAVATAIYLHSNNDGSHNYDAHCLVTGFTLLPERRNR